MPPLQSHGPLDVGPWPDSLDGRVVDADECCPRVFGYAVDNDLVANYGVGSAMSLALTGDLLDDARQRAFEASMVFVSAIGVNHAPGHAGVLSRVCATTPAATIGIVAICLAQEAAHVLSECAGLLSWLESGAVGTPPPNACAYDDADRSASRGFARRVASWGVSVPGLDVVEGRVACALATWTACGLSREAMTVAWVHARLAVACAEAFARPVLGMNDYPMNLPGVTYDGTLE